MEYDYKGIKSDTITLDKISQQKHYKKKLVKLKIQFYGYVVHKQSYDSSWSSVNKMFIKVYMA
jgi:hypothetical protein